MYIHTFVIKPRRACAARASGSCPVCEFVCLFMCYSNICSTAAFWMKICVFLAIISCFLGF